MRSLSFIWKTLAWISLAAILASCSPSPTPTVEVPTVNPQPTFNAIQTQAAQTVIADLTKNAPSVTPTQPATSTPLPATATPLPSATATLAPAASSTPVPPTATLSTTIYPSATAVVPTSVNFNCTVIDTLPKVTDKLAPRDDFDGNWVVMNTGLETWLMNDIDIVYVNGTKLQNPATLNGLDLTVNVLKNDKYTIIVDMVAPVEPGVYYTTWAMKHGATLMCYLPLTITVK
jgi:hypothetical protein